MIPRVDQACGLDVHKSTVSATVLRCDSISTTRSFPTTIDGLLRLREWIREHHCQRVLMEATGIYWIPVYSVLEDSDMEVFLVSPLFIKYVPGRKTDILDSAWIAEIALNGSFRPSYIPSREIRELRDLTRTHRRLIEERTSHKNRVHRLLAKNGIRLAGVLSDLFGRSGQILLAGLLEGRSLDDMLATAPSKCILRKREDIERAICGSLAESDIFIIRQSLDAIQHLTEQIATYQERIRSLMQSRKADLEILTSVPGIGVTIATAILAEIGNIRQFSEPKRLVSWAGLAPAVSESAGKTSYGHITKRGSRYLRTVLIEAAQVAARRGSAPMREFFARIRMKKGYKVAVVSLARKLLVLIYHLLNHQEVYEAEDGTRKNKIRIPSGRSEAMDLSRMIEILSSAGYVIQPTSPTK